MKQLTDDERWDAISRGITKGLNKARIANDTGVWKCCANCAHLVASGVCEKGLIICDEDGDWTPRKEQK